MPQFNRLFARKHGQNNDTRSYMPNVTGIHQLEIARIRKDDGMSYWVWTVPKWIDAKVLNDKLLGMKNWNDVDVIVADMMQLPIYVMDAARTIKPRLRLSRNAVEYIRTVWGAKNFRGLMMTDLRCIFEHADDADDAYSIDREIRDLVVKLWGLPDDFSTGNFVDHFLGSTYKIGVWAYESGGGMDWYYWPPAATQAYERLLAHWRKHDSHIVICNFELDVPRTASRQEIEATLKNDVPNLVHKPGTIKRRPIDNVS